MFVQTFAKNMTNLISSTVVDTHAHVHAHAHKHANGVVYNCINIGKDNDLFMTSCVHLDCICFCLNYVLGLSFSLIL